MSISPSNGAVTLGKGAATATGGGAADAGPFVASVLSWLQPTLARSALAAIVVIARDCLFIIHMVGLLLVDRLHQCERWSRQNFADGVAEGLGRKWLVDQRR